MKVTRRFSKFTALAVLTLGLAGSGCSYTKDRIRDFSDLLEISAGTGVGLNLRATNWLQVGLQFQGPRTKGSLLGFLTGNLAQDGGFGRGIRGITGPAAEMGFAPIYYFRAASITNEDTDRSVLLAKTLMQKSEDEEVLQRWYDSRYWKLYPGPRAYAEDYDRRLYDVGGSLHLGLGIDFAFNLLEFADFILGFGGLDIVEDDWSKIDKAPATTDGDS